MEPLSHTFLVKQSARFRKGFTLIELLVVFAIIGIVSAIVITSQGAFNNTLTLSNTAYDVALTIRSAQTYGLSSRTAGSETNAGYGVEFSSANPNSFVFFTDTYPQVGVAGVHCHPDTGTPTDEPGNCVYDPSQGELITTYTLGNVIMIDNICVDVSGLGNPGWQCSNSGAVQRADVVFARPNPTPTMTINGNYLTTEPISAMCISLKSPNGNHRYISVLQSGEISADTTSCPPQS